jgi:hypothetical protein
VEASTAKKAAMAGATLVLVTLQAALGVVALFALLALFCAGGIPKTSRSRRRTS